MPKDPLVDISRPGWIPFDLVFDQGQPLLEWRFIGQARLEHPWFEYSVRYNGPAVNGGVRPLCTAIEALDEPPPEEGVLPLVGIIFHTSRAGSTLVSRMLGCSRRLSVLAEPPIIESLINWSYGSDGEARASLIPRLRAALSYLGRRRIGSEEALVLKVESEHIIDQPLFEHCFPGVPWVFLFREPAAILCSQRHERGRQMVPFMIHPGRLELRSETIDPARLDEYCAVVLERTFAAAVEHLEAGKGRGVHYRQLPEYVWQQMGEYFSLRFSGEEIEAMQKQSRCDAKGVGGWGFDGGSSRYGALPDELLALAQGPLQEHYNRLLEKGHRQLP